MIHQPRESSPESLVQDAIARWREGERPDASEFLSRHPEVRERKSLAIDLIYEEYCLRKEHGETFVASTFCKRFPAYKQSLVRMLDVHQFLAHHAPDAAPSWPQPGDTFLGFEIVEQIGAGAVAKVYLAREMDVGSRTVVIKVSQFGRGEARLLGKLSHPGVVPIHSVHDDPLSGMTCICMPFLGTATLVDLLDEAFAFGAAPASAQVIGKVAPGYLPAGIDASAWRPVDPFFVRATYEEGIIHLGRQIVAALAKAHQAGITHRDIKPSNVLLSRDGRPMLLDFNLSTDERMPAERIGGTLAYMAPERIEALSTKPADAETTSDPRSDLYSVGAMLYELLTGQLPSRPPPTDGQRQPTLDEWLACRRTPPPSARTVNPRLEPAIDAVLKRCLAPQPEDRFSSAEQLLAALERLLAPRARLARSVRRRRRAILAGGVGLTAAVIGGGAYWFSLPPYPVRLYEAGLAAYDRGEYARAKRLFTDSMDAGNDSLEVYFARGQTHRQLGDTFGQSNDFAYVEQTDPSGTGRIYAGFAACESGVADFAISMLQGAMETGWDQISVANNLGIAFVQLRNDCPRGIQEFDRILIKFPDNDDVRYNRTRAWWHYSSNRQGLCPDDRYLKDAENLAAKCPRDRQVLNVTAFLLCNAAELKPEYRETALRLLKAAESMGTHPIHTYLWRSKATGEKISPPALAPGEPRPHLEVGWRWMPPPTSPRLAECVQALRAQERVH